MDVKYKKKIKKSQFCSFSNLAHRFVVLITVSDSQSPGLFSLASQLLLTKSDSIYMLFYLKKISLHLKDD